MSKIELELTEDHVDILLAALFTAMQKISGFEYQRMLILRTNLVRVYEDDGNVDELVTIELNWYECDLLMYATFKAMHSANPADFQDLVTIREKLVDAIEKLEAAADDKVYKIETIRLLDEQEMIAEAEARAEKKLYEIAAAEHARVEQETLLRRIAGLENRVAKMEKLLATVRSIKPDLPY